MENVFVSHYNTVSTWQTLGLTSGFQLLQLSSALVTATIQSEPLRETFTLCLSL